jgi:hypothetical protein
MFQLRHWYESRILCETGVDTHRSGRTAVNRAGIAQSSTERIRLSSRRCWGMPAFSYTQTRRTHLRSTCEGECRATDRGVRIVPTKSAGARCAGPTTTTNDAWEPYVLYIAAVDTVLVDLYNGVRGSKSKNKCDRSPGGDHPLASHISACTPILPLPLFSIAIRMTRSFVHILIALPKDVMSFGSFLLENPGLESQLWYRRFSTSTWMMPMCSIFL